MLYILCYPVLSQPDRDRIEAFRRAHEPLRAKLVQAHITLVFGVSSSLAGELLCRTQSVATKSEPFPVMLKRPRVWQDPISGQWKLFLEIGEGQEILKSLHRQLYAGLGDVGLRPDIPFEPHVTVATAPLADQIERAMDAVSELSLPIFGYVEALELAVLEADKLSTVDCIRLGGHSAEQV